MRLIDADWVAERLKEWRNWIAETCGENDDYVLCLDTVLMKLDDAPTADAVEVVRCKDCKFFRRYGFRLEYADCIKFDYYDTTEDGYCAWGERREDGIT